MNEAERNLTSDLDAEVMPAPRRMPSIDFDEALAKSILSQDEVVIDVDLHEGDHQATCWGCDLTYDYVKINGDYRT